MLKRQHKPGAQTMLLVLLACCHCEDGHNRGEKQQDFALR